MATRTNLKRRPRPRAPEATSADAFAIRGCVAGGVFLSVVAVWTPLHDIYVLPKLLVLCFASGASLVLLVRSHTNRGGYVSVDSRVPLVAGILVLGLGVATLINPHPMASLIGEYGRNGGLLAYLCSFVLLCAVVAAFRDREVALILWVLAAAAAVVILVGVAEVIGAHPFADTGDAVLSTLGQPNLVAGFLGVGTPALLWLALDAASKVQLRLIAAASLLLLPVVAVRAQSFQALPAIGAGIFPVLLLAALDRWSARRVLQVLAGAFVAILLPVALVRSSLEGQIRSGLDERVLMWQAAAKMIVDRPVAGNGPAGFAARFSEERPKAHTQRFGTRQLVDVPHNVPLSFVVSGGIPLGLAYLAFVGFTGRTLVLGLRRLAGSRQKLLAGIGGCWVAYQVQSLVGIDVPPLIALHFVLAGAVVVASGAPRTFKRLDFLRVGRAGFQAASAVVALVVVVLVSRAAIADRAYQLSLSTLASGDGTRAADTSAEAVALAGWNGLYWEHRAAVLAGSGDQDAALIAGERAAARAPSVVTFALATAQLAQRMGRNDVAEHHFASAVRHAPHDPLVLQAAAEFYSSMKDYQRAIPLIRTATALEPEGVAHLLLLGAVAKATGHDGESVRAYERVLRLQAGNLEALRALGRPVPTG